MLRLFVFKSPLYHQIASGKQQKIHKTSWFFLFLYEALCEHSVLLLVGWTSSRTEANLLISATLTEPSKNVRNIYDIIKKTVGFTLVTGNSLRNLSSYCSVAKNEACSSEFTQFLFQNKINAQYSMICDWNEKVFLKNYDNNFLCYTRYINYSPKALFSLLVSARYKSLFKKRCCQGKTNCLFIKKTSKCKK